MMGRLDFIFERIESHQHVLIAVEVYVVGTGELMVAAVERAAAERAVVGILGVQTKRICG